MRQRLFSVVIGLGIVILVFSMLVAPVAAQSDDSDDAYRTFWRIVAGILLVAFITVVAILMTTRWRRLFNRRDHGE